MKARLAAAVLLVVLVAGQALMSPAGAATKLTYSIKEARAYAFKVSLSKEAVEAVPKCNPDEDPYACSGYNHKNNCPKAIEVGEKGKAPLPKAPKGVQPISGAAGEGVGSAPPQSSPVRVNRFLSLAKLTHIFNVKEAGGLSSQIFTDLSGRSEPEAHTESEGFSDNKADYEERCYWNDGSENDETAYEHYISRSGTSPSTYHMAECVGRQCQFGAGVNAERARSILYLRETKGEVVGELQSFVEGLNFGDGAFTMDSVFTYARFSTDGTPQTLRWEVASTASGGKLGGQPVSLPPGDTISAPGFSVGMAKPYVDVPEDGRTLTIVAPGLHFGSDQQSAFFGGAEVYMSMGQNKPPVFDIDGPTTGTDIPSGGGGGGFAGGTSGGGFDFGSGGFGGGTNGQSGIEDPVALDDAGEVLIFEKATGIGAVPGIVALGIFCWFLLMARWLQRFAWGRKLTRMQPFRFIDWMYRAFVKT